MPDTPPTRLARIEAEDHVMSAQQDGVSQCPKNFSNRTIARNQGQVEGILSDALVCLKLAVDTAEMRKQLPCLCRLQ